MSGFDLARFCAANLSPREASVAVPDLAPFFADGADPVWIVRGLTGEEISRANEANARNQIIANAVEALASSSAARSDQVDALQSLIGAGGDVPLDLAKRFDHLVFGSVEPRCDRQTAVRLAASFPIVFFALTNRILELTGAGPDLGKSRGSGPIQGSEQPLPSAT